MNYARLPNLLIALGALFVGVMVVEAGALARSPGPFPTITVVNLLASLPFVALLVGGGSLLRREVLSPERYPRIVVWIVVSCAFFLTFSLLIAVSVEDGPIVRLGIVRWAASAGAGVGVLVGVFEARAIERAVAVESTAARNEELRRQNDRLEEFAGIVSHDLRNPLNVATGYAGILRDRYDDDELDRIAAAHDRMDQIIEEVLLLARSGKLIDDPEPVDLSAVVARSWSGVDTADATLDADVRSAITADPTRVQHLLENLIRNAVEHAGPDARIRIGTLSDGFYVEDDGPGIPERDRRAVLESGYTTKRDGTGFGLAIVQQIVDAHGWDLRVTEGTDGGARFEITGVDVDDDVDPPPDADRANPHVAVDD